MHGKGCVFEEHEGLYRGVVFIQQGEVISCVKALSCRAHHHFPAANGLASLLFLDGKGMQTRQGCGADADITIRVVEVVIAFLQNNFCRHGNRFNAAGAQPKKADECRHKQEKERFRVHILT